MTIRPTAILLSLLAVAPLAAQTDLRGHWSGPLMTPAATLTVEIDIDKAKGGQGWVGSFSIPEQGASGLPLDGITFADGKAEFHVKSIPGNPEFTGTLSADGKILDGAFTQGQLTVAMTLTRTGEPKVEIPRASTRVSPDFEGTWEGVIEAGMTVHIVLTIRNTDHGAEAELMSPDQGNVQIPVTAITQTGAKLTLEVKAVGGGYEGQINKEGTAIDGTWTQMGNSIGVKLTKSVKTQ